MGIIYKFRAPNGLEYIGKTKASKQKRKAQHKQSVISGFNNCPLLCAAIAEFGMNNFEMEILLECDDDDLNAKEIEMIEKHNTIAPLGLNIQFGGEGSSKASSLQQRSNDKIPVDFDTESLPENIRKINDIGYTVSYPDRETKTFQYSSEFLNLLRALTYWRYCRYIADGIMDMYVQGYKGGFCVKAPGYKVKYFVASSKSTDEKKKDALDYLNKLMFDNEVPQQPGSIRTLVDGFRVKFPGAKDKHFVAAQKTSQQKYEDAVSYLEGLRENGIPEPEFPKIKGLQKYRNGFRVKLPGQELVRFENAHLSKAELYQQASEYITNRS